MSSPREQIIAEARSSGGYRCPRCSYRLDGVPCDEAGRVLCPECGFAMRFVVDVRLVRGDQDVIQTRDSALHSGDRLMLIISVCVLLILAVLAVLTIVT